MIARKVPNAALDFKHGTLNTSEIESFRNFNDLFCSIDHEQQ